MTRPPHTPPATHAVEKSADEWLAETHTLQQAGRYDQAEEILAQLLQILPEHATVWHQAALTAYLRGQPQRAIARLERALQLRPQQALLHRDICDMYRRQGRLDDAYRHAERAVELAPDDASAHYNLGVIHYDRMAIDAAIAAIRRALALDGSMAEAHFELAEALLISGQFEAGWQEYEWRFKLPGAPRLLPPSEQTQWDGQPLAGTLLLIGDQGFGDTIQFSRYIALVAPLCGTLMVACSAAMRPIIAQQAGVARCYDRWEDVPQFDAYCPLSGLPRLFETRLATIPARLPYLAAEPARIAHWRQRIAQLAPPAPRRIGVVWAGSPSHANDVNRSMALSQLAVLADLPAVVLVSLQIGPAQADIAHYAGRAPLLDLGAEIRDFDDSMAILANLDHLVTVDTCVAHLAGALGVPSSVLLPFAPDWRWLMARRDTPWYPSLTLCRQAAPGQWQAALEQMLANLARPAGPSPDAG